MMKELLITLKDKDTCKWGPNECALRLTMVRLGANNAVLPYVDENSTLAERDFICEQLMKKYKNVKETIQNHTDITQEVLEVQKHQAIGWLIKMVFYFLVFIFVLYLFT
jgi:hypothetical protein